MAMSLPRSTPAEQQVDPAAVLAFLDALEERPDIEMHSIMVVRHGHVVTEGWWEPYSADRPQLLYSLSKIFTSTAAAFAQAEGLLDLDDTLVSHFDEFEADITDPRSRAVKLRDVAAMASGHTREMATEAAMRDPGEPIRGFLLIPPDRDPGTVFAYSQPCTFALASVIQRKAGMPLTEYLRPRLFDQLGIGPVGWQTWSGGLEQGFSGLHARTEDIAKLGQLYLQRGRWGDTQLIAEEWVAEATSVKVGTPGEPNTDWRQGYGYQFWMSRHGYRGDGAFGQFCVILPEHDSVVATTACTMDMQAVLDAMWTHLLPGLGVDTADAGVQQARLAARLSDLRLPPCFADSTPRDWQDWAAEPFPLAGAAEAISVPSTLTSIQVAPALDGWQVTLIEPGNTLSIPVGTGSWTVSSPTDSRGDT
ncbi:MAG TPA: serine hydrolase domain-containing protein, partial [Propionibacteriaceae bacterium]|nr:serine hydrolase domain-containing protein [Propionibacteriaceae bacterium]